MREIVMRWYEWFLAGLIASVVFALFLAVLANHAIGQSLREIVVESEGGAIPPPITGAPVQPPAAAGLPWQTFEEIHHDFVGDMQNPVCGDIEDSYVSFVEHDGVKWAWFWGNAKFALVRFGANRRPAVIYEGRVVAGNLIVVRTTPAEQLAKDSTPCAWFRAMES